MDLTGLYFGLIGQGDDEGWVNILVFVVMAVFWAVGGIIKSRSDKQKQQEKPRPASGKSQGPQTKSASKPVTRPQPVRPEKKPAVKPVPIQRQKRPTEKPTFDRLFAPEKIKRKMVDAVKPFIEPPDVKKEVQIKPEPAKKPVRSEKIKAELKEKQPATVEAKEEIVLNLSEPKNLRQAIIYHEVFGQCVGQREPDGQIWMR